jgi:hypothetical protein
MLLAQYLVIAALITAHIQRNQVHYCCIVVRSLITALLEITI